MRGIITFLKDLHLLVEFITHQQKIISKLQINKIIEDFSQATGRQLLFPLLLYQSELSASVLIFQIAVCYSLDVKC